MMVRLRSAALLLALLGLPAGAFGQPDPRQMSGIPLPDAELNDGTVSVRVIRGQLSNNVQINLWSSATATWSRKPRPMPPAAPPS